MRLAIVSTYPPFPCAIGLYSRKLLNSALEVDASLEAVVIAEEGADGSEDDRLRVVPTYRRSEDYTEKVLKAAIREGVEVVHFQHAPDLFGSDHRLPGLLERLGHAGVRSVVTLHSVYGERPWNRLPLMGSPGDFHRALGRTADRIVVHHREGMADRLVDQRVPREKLVVIPHGTTFLAGGDRAEGRRALGLPSDAMVFLFFGFIHVQKNVHTVVEAFLRMARRVPNAHLVVAGKPWGDRWYNSAYIEALKQRVRMAGLRDRVTFHDRYVPDELVPTYFSAADVLLLPHWQGYGSASGVFHQAIGAGKPLLFARGPKFEDGQAAVNGIEGLVLTPWDIGAWARSMERMSTDGSMRQRAGDALADYARHTAWPNVAERHLAVWRELASTGSPH